MPDLEKPRDTSEHEPGSMVVQTIIVSKERAKSAEEARKIAEGVAGHDPGPADETGTSYRYRQRNPSDFDESTFRTKEISTGVSIVAGKLRPKRATRCPGEALALSAGPEPVSESWIEVARLGEFRGHRAGDFAFTEETFGKLVENFNATRNRRVPVDYEHATEIVDGSVMQRGAPAVGWIVELQSRGAEGLWGRVEWVSPEAVSQVRSGQYRYFSPAVVFEATHPETGEDIGPLLTSGALTNRPFLDGMEPVTASLPPSDVHIPQPAAIVPPDNKERPMAEENREGTCLRRLRMKLAEGGHLPHPGATEELGPLEAIEEAVEKLIEEHKTMKAAKMAAEKAEAEEDAERAMLENAIPQSAREHVLAVRLSNRAAFNALWPAKPAAPSGPAATPAQDAALLSGRVQPPQSAPPERVTPSPARSLSDLTVERAEKLMADARAKGQTLDLDTAYTMASRQLKDEAVTSVMNNWRTP